MGESPYMILFKCFYRKNISFSECFSSFLLFKISLHGLYWLSTGVKRSTSISSVFVAGLTRPDGTFCYLTETHSDSSAYFKIQIRSLGLATIVYKTDKLLCINR